MKKNVIFWVLILLLAGAGKTRAQALGTALEDRRITIKMEKQPLGKVFEILISKYHIPIGFEESTFDRDHNDYVFETNLPLLWSLTNPPGFGYDRLVNENYGVFQVKENWITINVENGTVKEVFDSIVPQMKNYKWEINDEVINIFPIKGRDARYEQLLNLRVNDYFLAASAEVGLIKNSLLELPEIANFLNENELKTIIAPPKRVWRKPRIEFKYSDLTFRELLNKITKEKKGGWILKENDRFGSKDDEYIELEI